MVFWYIYTCACARDQDEWTTQFGVVVPRHIFAAGEKYTQNTAPPRECPSSKIMSKVIYFLMKSHEPRIELKAQISPSIAAFFPHRLQRPNNTTKLHTNDIIRKHVQPRFTAIRTSVLNVS